MFADGGKEGGEGCGEGSVLHTGKQLYGLLFILSFCPSIIGSLSRGWGGWVVGWYDGPG